MESEMNYFPIILGVLLWSVIPGIIAKAKKRSFCSYYFLGLLISPLFATVVILFMDKVVDYSDVLFSYKCCDKCGERLIINANYCRKCGEPTEKQEV